MGRGEGMPRPDFFLKKRDSARREAKKNGGHREDGRRQEATRRTSFAYALR